MCIRDSLIIFGVTTTEKLKKNRAYIIIGSFVLGMLLTPPDVISQFLIAIPIWILFEAGLFFSTFFKIRHKHSSNIKESNDWNSESHNKMMDEIETEMYEDAVLKGKENNL